LRLLRILVVEDFADFRRVVCSTLKQRPEFRITEASDGLEAVKKAEELQPHLILLDIGLPSLSGLEVARRLRKLAPAARILFLSQESSPEVVQEALFLGLGYVHKAHSHSDLPLAIEAVLAGKRFISPNLARHGGHHSVAKHDHEMLFYSSETVLMESLTRFVAKALGTGNPAIVVATKSHLEDLRERLIAQQIDVDAAYQKGTYIALDVAEAFSTLMTGAQLDSAGFLETIGGLAQAASKRATAEQPRVAFCGEGIGLLWVAGRTDEAMRLEQLCNELSKNHELEMLCAYPLVSLQSHENDQSLQIIRAEHTAVRTR
jgi:DNA-binding NarL/FixJ family response regulator